MATSLKRLWRSCRGAGRGCHYRGSRKGNRSPTIQGETPGRSVEKHLVRSTDLLQPTILALLHVRFPQAG